MSAEVLDVPQEQAEPPKHRPKAGSSCAVSRFLVVPPGKDGTQTTKEEKTT